jgi:eukaryotic-like serine/threonine-protein kinase
VAVLDHGTGDDGVPFIVMEHLEGETLHERLRARGRISPVETAEIVISVCRALSRAHEAGLVHRDIKPENVFLAKDAETEIVKVIDFGVVKVTDALGWDGVDPTATGALIGTPNYMSPEQAQGLKNVDHRSDLWSIALVAIECLTGQRLFKATSIGPLVKQIVVDPIPPPSKLAPEAGIGPAIDAWAARGLERDPSSRFTSAAELADAFTKAAEVAVSFGRPSTPPLSKPSSIDAQIITPSDAETVALPTIPFERAASVDQPPTRRWWRLGLLALGLLVVMGALFLWR